ncbi:uncharacterized protein LOC131936045 [Physella acuta]|uniref:uncharacterized protein LOC131936045 n=1 Tax=Physella acuta TaxID=109671 RepID=UPI0027DCC74F|nr:uncharacterized protein LOC131936045 [Physella acuta]
MESSLDSGYDYDGIPVNSSDFGEEDSCGYGEAGDSQWLELTVYPLLLLQGIVGNLMSIPVLVRISRNSWSTVMYLALLTGTDLIILLIRCGGAWYDTLMMVKLSQQIMNSSDAVCKTYMFAFTLIKHVSPWLTVAISVEMMIATRWPWKTYVMCTAERSRYVLMLITIIIVCLDINFFWTYGAPVLEMGCRYTEEFSEQFREWIWPALDNAVELVLPLVTVSVCFFLTATTMIRRPVAREHDMGAEMEKYFFELGTLRDFRTICLVVCLVFICLHTFQVIYHVINFLYMKGYLHMDCAAYRSFDETVLDIGTTLTYVFYGAKIYLYLALSSAFRTRVRQGLSYLLAKLRAVSKYLCKCGTQWIPISLQETSPAPRPPADLLLVRADHSGEASTISAENRPRGEPFHQSKGEGSARAGADLDGRALGDTRGQSPDRHEVMPLQAIGTKV